MTFLKNGILFLYDHKLYLPLIIFNGTWRNLPRMNFLYTGKTAKSERTSQMALLKVFNLLCVKSAPSTHGLLDMDPNKFLFWLNVFELVLFYLK